MRIDRLLVLLGVLLLATVLCVIPRKSHASCITNWPTTSQQQGAKAEHTAMTFAVVTATTAFTDNLWAGVGVAVALSAAREIEKATTPGWSCEYSSMTFDALGILLGIGAVKYWDIGSGRRASLSVTPTGSAKEPGVAVTFNSDF